jgi:response regulator of citrate/malate metabolism
MSTRTRELAAVATCLALRSQGVTAEELAGATGCSVVTALRTLRRLGRFLMLREKRRRGGRAGSHAIQWKGDHLIDNR